VAVPLPRKPPCLRPGDRVAVLSPSWGGPSVFPRIHELGVRVLRDDLGLDVVEMPSARAPAAFLDEHPEARAADVNAAFADPSIRAIVATIGGDDAVRILPFLDVDLALRQPKVLMGYSDTTALLAWLNVRGLVTFNGPTVMAGLAQAHALPPSFLDHVRRVLFEGPETCPYEPYPWWSEGYPDWADRATAGEVLAATPNEPWRFLQGEGAVEGRLFGGCVEVLEFLKGTRFWPPLELWEGRILFLETSEEAPPPDVVKRMLRNYGSQGILDRLAGLLVGRPRGYSPAQKDALDEAVLKVVRRELGRTEMPIVTRMDFGHTDPQLILPLGVTARIDCEARRVGLVEAAVTRA
jgi:muramoyltetrapeptide carboxypeptidase LdcA involved in peptidoglycan recycling